MAFADPQSVTINAVANSLPRTSSGVNSGAFKKDDGNVTLEVSHQYGKSRTRRTIRLTHRKIAADVYTADNVLYSMSTYIVVDTPTAGYTLAEAKQVVDGLAAYLTTGTGARVTQLLGGEN